MIKLWRDFARWLRTPWVLWSMFCMACWVPWIFFSKLGSNEIPPRTMQYLYNLGGVPVGLALLIRRRFRLERQWKGISLGLLVGVISAVGQAALFGAYATGANTAVVTVVTALYPLVTVLLAFLFLRERLSRAQIAGLGFAVAAFILFSE